MENGQRRGGRQPIPSELPSDENGVLTAEVVEGELTLPEETSAVERELETELRRQLRQMDEVGVGGLDLTETDYDNIQRADHTRLARLTYGMGYLRLLAFLSRKPPNMSVEAQQAKLSLAYIQHVETNDRETLRISSRTVGEAQLDKDLTVLREEVTRIATIRQKRAERFVPRATESNG